MVTFRICVVLSNDRFTAVGGVADAGSETIPRMSKPNTSAKVQELDTDKADIKQK